MARGGAVPRVSAAAAGAGAALLGVELRPARTQLQAQQKISHAAAGLMLRLSMEIKINR